MRMYRTRALGMEVELKHILKADPKNTAADQALKELREQLKATEGTNSVAVKFDSGFIRSSIERMTDPEVQAMKKEKASVIESAPKWELVPANKRPWNQKEKKSQAKKVAPKKTSRKAADKPAVELKRTVTKRSRKAVKA